MRATYKADDRGGSLRHVRDVTTRNERAGIDDRWHKRVKESDGTMRTERSAVYGKVSRWRVRWVDSTGAEVASSRVVYESDLISGTGVSLPSD